MCPRLAERSAQWVPRAGHASALITGAASGIGAAFARQLAANGHRLILVDQDGKRLTALAVQLQDQLATPIQIIVANLADPADVERTADSIAQIEAGRFLPHSGIRFPQNGCVSCPHLGLCLNNQELVEAKLIRRPGASDLDWLDQLE